MSDTHSPVINSIRNKHRSLINQSVNQSVKFQGQTFLFNSIFFFKYTRSLAVFSRYSSTSWLIILWSGQFLVWLLSCQVSQVAHAHSCHGSADGLWCHIVNSLLQEASHTHVGPPLTPDTL